MHGIGNGLSVTSLVPARADAKDNVGAVVVDDFGADKKGTTAEECTKVDFETPVRWHVDAVLLIAGGCTVGIGTEEANSACQSNMAGQAEKKNTQGK